MDWSEMINKILASGATQASIAREVGYSTTWVRKVANGEIADVSWDAGQTLIKLERRARRAVKKH